MEKRLFLALGLSILIIYLWSGLMPKTQTLTPSPANITLKDIKEQQVGEKDTLEFEEPIKDFSLDIFLIKYYEKSACFKEILFKKFSLDKLILFYGFYIPKNELIFSAETNGNNLIFSAKEKNKEFKKVFNFYNNSNFIELSLIIKNITETEQSFELPIWIGGLDFTDHSSVLYSNYVIDYKDKIEHINGRKEAKFDNIRFVALRNKYFCLLVEPYYKDYSAFIQKIEPQKSILGLKKTIKVLPHQEVVEKFRVYLGPQDINLLASFGASWTNVINYGKFDIIAQIIVQTIKFFYRLTKNWGLAIILMTLLIQLLLYPISITQAHSMKKMQALQPSLDALRKKYSDNPQKLNKEIMELYRENKVNPFSGCFPLLIQIPIFMALYQVQSRLIYFKNASFLWIKDLSSPDQLLTIPQFESILGTKLSLNILPIFMAIFMLLQQKFTLSKTGGETNQQQKMMMIIFPVMLLLFLYNASAAFNLYMLVTNIVMFLYQLKIYRLSK